MPKERQNRPEVDDLLPDVDQEMRSNQSTEEIKEEGSEDDIPTGRANDLSASQQNEKESSRQDDMSAFAKKLEVLMDGPDSPYVSEVPRLSARSNGYLSDEVETALQQAASVLKDRHSKASKSLIMNYAIRVALWDLRKNAEDSTLVKWLDEAVDT